MVDKLRASLPGGVLNGYFTDIGMSAAWARYTNIDLAQLRSVVESAQSEDEVASWIADRTAGLDKERINTKLEGMVTARIPEAWQAAFESAYPQELRERYKFIFDLIEADDALMNACGS